MYRSAILVSVARNCCNPYLCTRCGSVSASVYCCDETEPVSLFAREAFTAHPIRQPHYAEEMRRQPVGAPGLAWF